MLQISKDDFINQIFIPFIVPTIIVGSLVLISIKVNNIKWK